jgi:urease accessory protein
MSSSTAPSSASSGGLLDLRLERGRDAVTRIVRRAQRFPLHLTAPLYLDASEPGLPFLYVQNPSGGVFAGDRFRIRLEVGPRARVHVTTPSATQLMRTGSDGGRQDIELVLDDGAYIELLPEPVIPHAGSRFEQRLEAELAPRAALVAGEILAPGRLARGELFAYERLLLSTRVTQGGRELCVDTLLLEPRLRSPAARGLLGGSRYLATLLVVAPERPGLAEQVAAGVLEGASGELPNDAGVVVRILADAPAVAARALARAWSVAREALLGHPAPRLRK